MAWSGPTTVARCACAGPAVARKAIASAASVRTSDLAGQSIQAAVDAATAGDTIRVFGTHRENVAIQTDGLTLRGVVL